MIGIPKKICCKNPKCRHRFKTIIGDVRPQRIECPKCGYIWFYTLQ